MLGIEGACLKYLNIYFISYFITLISGQLWSCQIFLYNDCVFDRCSSPSVSCSVLVSYLSYDFSFSSLIKNYVQMFHVHLFTSWCNMQLVFFIYIYTLFHDLALCSAHPVDVILLLFYLLFVYYLLFYDHFIITYIYIYIYIYIVSLSSYGWYTLYDLQKICLHIQRWSKCFF